MTTPMYCNALHTTKDGITCDREEGHIGDHYWYDISMEGQDISWPNDLSIIEWYIRKHGLFACCMERIREYVKANPTVNSGKRIYCTKCKASIVLKDRTWEWGVAQMGVDLR